MISKEELLSKLPPSPKWLKDYVIFLTRSGSHLYGTNIEGSDEDYVGVCKLPGNVLFGFTENFDQTVLHDPDLTIFSIIKFARLAAETNPNVLEILFVDDANIIYTTPLWEKLRAIKHMFLSKRIAVTFAGYATSQLHKIRTHRNYLLHPVKEIPTREQFELPERALVPKLHAAHATVQKQIDSIAGEWQVDKTKQIELYPEVAKGLGFDSNFIDLLYKEKKYAVLRAEKEAYDLWAKSRNPKRKAIEEKCGYDSKNLMHLVRLYRSCIECLKTGTLQVNRPDAKELIEIRQGSWPFEKIETWVQDSKQRLETALANTKLPARTNLVEIEKVIIDIVKDGV